jgi:holliday junction DNA helicase RuvA
VIASLRGALLRKDAASAGSGVAVIEVGGVGYRAHVSTGTIAALPEPGAEVFLHTVTVVREDSFSLFGFSDAEELALFNLLVLVKGIGPRLALTALSGMRPRELAGAIAAGDASRVATVPGIGRKTAERVILELRDKVSALTVLHESSPFTLSREEAEDLVSALANMGFRPSEAKAALRQVMEKRESPPPLDTLIRECLKVLSAGRIHG